MFRMSWTGKCPPRRRLEQEHGNVMMRAALAGLLFALLLPFCLPAPIAGAATTGSGDPPSRDQGITDAIEDELMYDIIVPHAGITVDTKMGIARLGGVTPDLLSKERAARIAETVRGVRSVVNEIEVAPLLKRSDPEIREDVEHALLLDPATEAYEIDVAIADGVAALSGSVDSWQEKKLAERVAKSVRGVKAVTNGISVRHAAARPDQEIAPEIRKALRRDVLVDDGMINVRVDDGVAHLMGTVGSAAEKTRAIGDAWVSGVSRIDASKLEVEPWADNPQLRKNKYVMKNDGEIRRAVEDALLIDPRVSSAKVETQVRDGLVTLRGEVTNLRARRAAAQDARYTVGVERVVNRLKVKPVRRAEDKAIATAIREALQRDVFTTLSGIDVNVRRGVVTLQGTVDSHFEKSRADNLASLARGVVAVDNKLEVADHSRSVFIHDPYVYDEIFLFDNDWYDYSPSLTFKSDAEIREDIHTQFLWSPFVDGDDITVTVDDGVATLTGTVDSWPEKLAAVDNAYEGGAVWVDDDLVIDGEGAS